MVCIYCGSETLVFNSRHQKRANTVWRRRKCTGCGALYSTTEQVDYEKSWTVVAENGSTSPFLRDKLFISLYKSLGHRPTATNDAVGLTATVLSKLRIVAQDGSLTPTAIATLCTGVLQRFDKAAAVTYQAYHAAVL